MGTSQVTNLVKYTIRFMELHILGLQKGRITFKVVDLIKYCNPLIVLPIKVGVTHIAVNFEFHSWFANFKLT